MNHKHMFDAAKEASLQSDYSGRGQPHIGCVVSYKGTILAKGCNTDKTHSTQDKYNKWRYKNSNNHYLPSKLHAEINCINKIKYLDIDMSKVHVYVYRETRDGHIASSRPCPACMHAIKDLGIKHIHYTTDMGFAHEKILQKN